MRWREHRIVGWTSGVVLLLAVGAAAFILLGAAAPADSEWETGDLSEVAGRLGVVPKPDGRYVLADILLAIEERLPDGQPDLFIEITNRDFAVYRGNPATLEAKTLPRAYCTITVVLPSGHTSEARGLEPKNADLEGNVSWTWLVGGSTGTGFGKIYVDAQANGSAVCDVIEWEVKRR